MNLKKEIEEIYNEINKNNRDNIKEVGEKYQKLLKYLFYDDELSLIESKEYVSVLYRMIFETRDIVDGKGEYKFAHMLIGELVKFGYTEHGYELKSITDSLANTAILNIIYYHAYADKPNGNTDKPNGNTDKPNGNTDKPNGNTDKPNGNTNKPYGSWKDIKYFCNYLKEEILPDIGESDITQLSIFQYILNIVVKQLKEDREAIHRVAIKNNTNTNPSLLCKWLPREKSDKFGWLARHIAVAYYPEFLKNNKITNNQSYRKAIRKCLTHYRQLVAEINKQINPPQINQCNQQWQCIDFNNVSSQTLNKQALAFEYVDEEGNSRGDDEDRIKCRENYQNYHNNTHNNSHNDEIKEEEEKKYFLWDEINVILSHNKYNWAEEEINSIWMLDDDETLYNNDDNKEEDEVKDDEDVKDVKDDEDVKDVEEQSTDYLMVVNDVKEEKKNNGWFGWLGWQ